jgi:DNA-binding IclR family transcriptional regulator
VTARNPRWVWLDHVSDHVRVGALNSNASHVAHILAVHYINGDQQGWPSQATLATATGLSENTVRRALHDLEHRHLLEIRKGSPTAKFGLTYNLLNTSPGAGSNNAKHLTSCGVRRESKSVLVNALTPSHSYVSPSSNDGDLVLVCLTAPGEVLNPPK